jgi:Domain of unknown function (DUF397)
MDWRKSTYSGTTGGSCVETASNAGSVLVRDTTDRDGGTLAFPAGAWEAFTASLRLAVVVVNREASPLGG